MFPNTGLVIATVSIEQVLQSEALLWVSSLMTVLQVSIWLAVGLPRYRLLRHGACFGRKMSSNEDGTYSWMNVIRIDFE